MEGWLCQFSLVMFKEDILCTVYNGISYIDIYIYIYIKTRKQTRPYLTQIDHFTSPRNCQDDSEGAEGSSRGHRREQEAEFLQVKSSEYAVLLFEIYMSPYVMYT